MIIKNNYYVNFAERATGAAIFSISVDCNITYYEQMLTHHNVAFKLRTDG